MLARIVAIADVFDVLYHARYYKPALPLEDVLKAMIDGSSSYCDPRLLELFIKSI